MESLLLLVLLLSDHIVALVVAIGGAQRGEREAPCEGGGRGPAVDWFRCIDSLCGP